MEFLWNFLEGMSRHTKFRRNFAAFSAVTSARLLRQATSPRSCDTNSTMLRSSHCEETRKDRRSQQHISWSFQQGIQTTSITIHRATQMPHMMFTSLFPATESEKTKHHTSFAQQESGHNNRSRMRSFCSSVDARTAALTEKLWPRTVPR